MQLEIFPVFLIIKMGNFLSNNMQLHVGGDVTQCSKQLVALFLASH